MNSVVHNDVWACYLHRNCACLHHVHRDDALFASFRFHIKFHFDRTCTNKSSARRQCGPLRSTRDPSSVAPLRLSRRSILQSFLPRPLPTRVEPRISIRVVPSEACNAGPTCKTSESVCTHHSTAKPSNALKGRYSVATTKLWLLEQPYLTTRKL